MYTMQYLMDGLNEYNEKIFQQLWTKEKNLQLGFFNGNRILFIGQNPGYSNTSRVANSFIEYQKRYYERIKKYPLGQYIEKICKADWDNISLTNVVKMPTINNAIPDKKLIDFFRPITQKQIELLKPELIVCMGKVAGNEFGLTDFYKLQTYQNSKIMMILHHGFLTRQGGWDDAIRKSQEIIDRSRDSLRDLLL